jgi:hypothetical protein
MDISQLPDIDSMLVTADNPARADLPGMDYTRCAALHNYLVLYAWVAEGRTPASLHGNNMTFFTKYAEAAEELRSRLEPSLAAFLAAAIIPPVDADEHAPPFFFWAHGLSDPDDIFDSDTADLFDHPADSLVCLYPPGQAGESGGGLLYDQGCHRAAVFMHMDDHGFALPAESHPELWHPLEIILSNWIELLRIGKMAASPTDAPSLFDSEKFGPWEWRPYGDAQVTACVGAWDRLCAAIEARVVRPPSTVAPARAAAPPLPPLLLAPAALDAASVPETCFARAFLTRARRPGFRCIAPGLHLPPSDASEFAAMQLFTGMPRGPLTIPPVCLFSTVRGGRAADLTAAVSRAWNDFRGRSADAAMSSLVPAGVYSELVERNEYDNTEEGFRLLLPYGLEGEHWESSEGARKSDCSFVTQGKMDDLFQHGYKPFGGDYYRPQRLERLLDHWCKLVDEGVWSVGPQGVEGTIDTFRNADTGHWRDYVISPTW